MPHLAAVHVDFIEHSDSMGCSDIPILTCLSMDSIRCTNFLTASLHRKGPGLMYPPDAWPYLDLCVFLSASLYVPRVKRGLMRLFDPQAHFNLGVVLFESLHMREEGLQKYYDSIAIEPNFADAYHTVSKCQGYTVLSIL